MYTHTHPNIRGRSFKIGPREGRQVGKEPERKKDGQKERKQKRHREITVYTGRLFPINFKLWGVVGPKKGPLTVILKVPGGVFNDPLQ